MEPGGRELDQLAYCRPGGFDRLSHRVVPDPEPAEGYRGIKGTYVYARDPALREYLKRHMPVFHKAEAFRLLSAEEALANPRAVPFADIYAAVGGFSELQLHDVDQWVALPLASAGSATG